MKEDIQRKLADCMEDVYIHIYIYRERERERFLKVGKQKNKQTTSFEGGKENNPQDFSEPLIQRPMRWMKASNTPFGARKGNSCQRM